MVLTSSLKQNKAESFNETTDQQQVNAKHKYKY